jgi:FixJ family two-component response regulator
VLIYSAYADHALALAAIIAGADGTISKSTLGDDVVRAIVAIAAGRTQHPDPPTSVTRTVAQQLDERDLPILAMLVNHVPPTEIADVLQISEGWLEARRWAMLQHILRTTNGAHRRGLTDEPRGHPDQTELENPRSGRSSTLRQRIATALRGRNEAGL